MIAYGEKLARVLDAMGGLYTLDDILARVRNGTMQSHVINNTWAVTEINRFPRAKQLHVVALVGDLDDIEAMDERILTYAKDVEADLISAYGRPGWTEAALRLGWTLKAKNYLFHKEVR